MYVFIFILAKGQDAVGKRLLVTNPQRLILQPSS